MDIKGIAELDYIKHSDRTVSESVPLRHTALSKSRLPSRSTTPSSPRWKINLAVVQTRNYGTIGGNVCHGDPAADPPSVFIVLNAQYKLMGSSGERMINAGDFYKDYLEVDLAPDELLCEIRVPRIPAHTGVAHDKLMAQKGDMGIVGAAASITVNPSTGVCEDARIVLTNVSSTPFRAKSFRESPHR